MPYKGCRVLLLEIDFYLFSVRLWPNDSYGTVQIRIHDRYKLICADGFDDSTANVICRMFAYPNFIHVYPSAFGVMNLPIFYYNVSCIGNELSVLDCDYRTGLHGCPSYQYASLICTDAPNNHGELLFKGK